MTLPHELNGKVGIYSGYSRAFSFNDVPSYRASHLIYPTSADRHNSDQHEGDIRRSFRGPSRTLFPPRITIWLPLPSRWTITAHEIVSTPSQCFKHPLVNETMSLYHYSRTIARLYSLPYELFDTLPPLFEVV